MALPSSKPDYPSSLPNNLAINPLATMTNILGINWRQQLHQKFPSENLCLAGGVAMNSVANGKISHHTPFKNIYVPVGTADMRDIINLKIKFREKFRPFAPSILEEKVSDFFELHEPSPFMERVLSIQPEKRSLIPAVTHVDGSGGLQTVSKAHNPLYWQLINTFYQRTQIPLLLNTSLNENEPIVRTPDEAILCFLRTQMDGLVLGSYYYCR